MTFPAAPLDVAVDLNLGTSGWTPIAPYVLQREGTSPAIKLARGRQDETSQATAGTCSMQWNNRDGRFSPRNPAGPYYGLLGRNTPVRVSVPRADGLACLRLEDDRVSFAQCADSSALQITGSIDVRADVLLTDWQECTIAAKWGTTTSTRAWNLSLSSSGCPVFRWQDGGGSEHAYASTQPLPFGRFMIRASLSASAGTLTFYTSATMGGAQAQLGSVVSFAATSVAAAAGQPVVAGYCTGMDQEYPAPQYGFPSMAGSAYELQIRNSSGTLVADPLFYAQAPGARSFPDAQGNTWVLSGTATIDNRSYRGHFECSSLPQQWDPTGADVWTPVSASGVLRRLSQNSAPVASTLRRYYTNVTGINLAAYWPCEDPQGSTQIASAVTGVAPMALGGLPSFQGQAGSLQADQYFPCSASLPEVGSSRWVFTVPRETVQWTDNTTRLCLYESAGSIPDVTTLISVYSTGTVAQLALVYGTVNNGSLELIGYSASGAQLFASGYLALGIDGNPVRVSMDLLADGSNVTWQIQVVFVGGGTGVYSGTLTSASVGAVIGGTVNPGPAALGDTEIGHVSVQGLWDSLFDQAEPLNAWNGEAAAARFARLCGENGIASRIYGWVLDSVAMGYQTIDTLPNLLQYCEDSDRGMIYEPATCLGLGYRTVPALDNQSPAVTLDYLEAHIGGDGSEGLVPEDDDQYLVNDVAISRNGGSSAQVQVTTGPLSIAPPPAGAGDYATSVTVYIQHDLGLPHLAGWIAHVGTTDEERYPSIPLNLARPELAGIMQDILDTNLGDCVQAVNLPPWLPPGAVKQLAWGVSEQLGGFWYLLAWNSVPESPYEVAVAGTGALDSAHCAPVAAALSAATTAPLNINPLFSLVFGEGSLEGWTAYLGSLSTDGSVTYPGGPLKWSAVYSGLSGGGLVSSSFTAIPGGSYGAGAYVWSPVSVTAEIGMDWYDGATYLSQSLTSVSVPAGTWTPVASGPLTAPAGTTLAYLVILTTGTVLAAQCAAAWQPGALQVTGDTWTTAPADYPFGVLASGEEMTAISAGPAADPGTTVGVFLNESAMGLSSLSAAWSLWETWTGLSPGCTRFYLSDSGSWTISADMAAMIAAGVRLLISIRPQYNPVSASDLAALGVFIGGLQAAGAAASFTIYSEPFYSGLTSVQYIAAVQYYGPVIRAAYPLAFVTATSSVANNGENSYFPYDTDGVTPLVDLVATDYYTSGPSIGWDDLPAAAAPADQSSPPLPFGLWECNGSASPSVGQTQSQVTAFFTYITGYFQGRIAAGQPCADICLFSGAPGENFLGCATTQAAGFEGGTANWTGAGNANVADSTAQAHSGTHSLAMTAQAAGSQIQAASCASANITTQGMPVTAGQKVDLAGWFRAAATARAVQVGIQWFTSSSTSISSVYGSTVTDSAASFTTQAVLSGTTAPSGTAYARMLAQVDATVAANEVHYLDDCEMRIVSGSNPANVTTIEFPWDYRIALWQDLFTALNATSYPQQMTVVRSVNGVLKAHVTGEPLTLAQAPVAALL